MMENPDYDRRARFALEPDELLLEELDESRFEPMFLAAGLVNKSRNRSVEGRGFPTPRNCPLDAKIKP